NIGQSATLGRVQITGVNTPIDESFATPTLSPDTWQVVAEHAAGVIPVPPSALFWLTWTVPDTGFKLQTAQSLPGTWSDLANSNIQLGSRKRVLVFSSSLPASDTGNYFFRLIK